MGQNLRVIAVQFYVHGHPCYNTQMGFALRLGAGVLIDIFLCGKYALPGSWLQQTAAVGRLPVCCSADAGMELIETPGAMNIGPYAPLNFAPEEKTDTMPRDMGDEGLDWPMRWPG